MAKTQCITGEIFESLYLLVEERLKGNEDLVQELSCKIYEVERKVMLELIKRDYVEKGLTERVLLYSDHSNGYDELTGAA
ncbi:hypothetical protein [Dyadobacter sp. LHD-138]|uniref:hypothetical protein n=1 Tax=Dyadobacter sp. LHD-138 TaxID=3071413 RepID=UPI0027E0FB85|nr:hypothetical protein [Dyadobacter sp. LHD-138]MDQ6482355.1 hypothetical protein [Dyadobacter sp. LHD-138]